MLSKLSNKLGDIILMQFHKACVIFHLLYVSMRKRKLQDVLQPQTFNLLPLHTLIYLSAAILWTT